MLLHTQQAKVNYTSDINIDGWLLYQHVILFYCFFLHHMNENVIREVTNQLG